MATLSMYKVNGNTVLSRKLVSHSCLSYILAYLLRDVRKNNLSVRIALHCDVYDGDDYIYDGIANPMLSFNVMFDRIIVTFDNALWSLNLSSLPTLEKI